MSKLKENINPGYFLFVSEWWGLSANAGMAGFFVYPDGSYTKKKIYFMHPENNMQENGKLSQAELTNLNEFLDANVKTSTSKRIFDYGCRIEYAKNNTEIQIENDQELFGRISKIIPFEDAED